MESTNLNEEVLNPSSPPTEHEKQKLAHTKQGGQMTFEKSQLIAKRVVSW